MRTERGASFTSVQALLRWAAALAPDWRKLIGAPYRPEKHYMRGPGPKWREKREHVVGQHPSDAARGS